MRPPRMQCGDPRSARLVVLIYNTMWGAPPALRGLALPEGCAITTDREYLQRADAVVFHTPTLLGFPRLPKRPGQRWIGWSMECRRIDPRFDLTMTYHRDSDVWTPYFGPKRAARLRTPPGPKSELACCFVSGFYDRSRRTEYLRELMRHMPVDCYGRLFRNRKLPQDLGRSSRLQLFSRYRFVLAFENSLDRDYVTEKFFDPFEAGAVPVYRGAPNAKEFAPGENSFVDVHDFPDPRALAERLQRLAASDDYERMLEWKEKPFLPGFAQMIEDNRESAWVRLCRRLA